MVKILDAISLFIWAVEKPSKGRKPPILSTTKINQTSFTMKDIMRRLPDEQEFLFKAEWYPYLSRVRDIDQDRYNRLLLEIIEYGTTRVRIGKVTNHEDAVWLETFVIPDLEKGWKNHIRNELRRQRRRNEQRRNKIDGGQSDV